MSETLFEGWEPEERTPRPSEDMTLSAGRRLTLRQAEMIEDGIHPLTRGRLHNLASRARDAEAPKADPFTCGSCWFREVVKYHDRSYAKCYFGVTNEDRRAPRVSNGPATDVRAWWPACPDYSPGDSISDDAARCIP